MAVVVVGSGRSGGRGRGRDDRGGGGGGLRKYKQSVDCLRVTPATSDNASGSVGQQLPRTDGDLATLEVRCGQHEETACETAIVRTTTYTPDVPFGFPCRNLVAHGGGGGGPSIIQIRPMRQQQLKGTAPLDRA